VGRERAGVVEHGTVTLQPRRLTVLGEQHEPATGHGDHRPCDDQSAQVIPAVSFGSSLGTGEDVVLRGCELGHNAQGVDRHGIHLGGTPDIGRSDEVVPGAMIRRAGAPLLGQRPVQTRCWATAA
jgi:hypothetical protein